MTTILVSYLPIYLTLHISIYNFTLFIYVSTYILFPSPSSFYHTHTHTQHTHTHISVRSDFHIYSGQQLHSSRSGDKKDDIIIIYMNKNIHICLYVSIKENGGALFESILSGRGRSISFGDGRISDEWRLGSLAVGFVDRYYFFSLDPQHLYKRLRQSVIHVSGPSFTLAILSFCRHMNKAKIN